MVLAQIHERNLPYTSCKIHSFARYRILYPTKASIDVVLIHLLYIIAFLGFPSLVVLCLKSRLFNLRSGFDSKHVANFIDLAIILLKIVLLSLIIRCSILNRYIRVHEHPRRSFVSFIDFITMNFMKIFIMTYKLLFSFKRCNVSQRGKAMSSSIKCISPRLSPLVCNTCN